MKVTPLSKSALEFVVACAQRWAQKYPALKTRLLRALDLVEAPDALRQDGQGRWLVAASDGNGHHVVEVGEEGAACSCEDATYRGMRCKHQLAVALRVVLEARYPQGGPLTIEAKDITSKGGQHSPVPPREPRALKVRTSSAVLERVCREHEARNTKALEALPEASVIPLRAPRDPKTVPSSELLALLARSC